MYNNGFEDYMKFEPNPTNGYRVIAKLWSFRVYYTQSPGKGGLFELARELIVNVWVDLRHLCTVGKRCNITSRP